MPASSSSPWKLRFRAPRVVNTQMASLHPSRGVVAMNWTGVYQVYRWHVPSGELRQITDLPGGLTDYFLSPDGRYVVYFRDDHGNEIGHYVRFAYDGTLEDGAVEDLTPGLPAFSPARCAFSRAGNKFGFIASQPDGFHLHIVPFDEDGAIGQSREVFYSPVLMLGMALSSDGTVAVVNSTEKSGTTEYNLTAINTETGEKIGELYDGEGTSIGVIRFSPIPGDQRMLAWSNRTGFETLLVWNPSTGERVDLAFEGLDGAAYATDWAEDGDRILFRVLSQAVQQYYVYNLQSKMLTKLNHPTGTISVAFFAPGGEIFGQVDDAANPTRLVALDGETGEYLRDVIKAGEVPPGRGWRSVHFPSSDGEGIQGWLATPSGNGPFPAVINLIGGPGGVQQDNYDPGAQAWLDEGFAYFSINYRGCTTFGNAFESKIFGNPGYWEVEDTAAAYRYLVEQGIAERDKVFLLGNSYGSFVALLAAGLDPDLWAGVMAKVAITDWALQYEDSSDMLKGFLRAFFGGTPDEKHVQYAKSSPVTYVDKIQAPILIFQGKHDTRTPARPVEIFEQKMKALGKDIEVLWFGGGHGGGFGDVEMSIQHQEMMLAFAHRVLDGPGV